MTPRPHLVAPLLLVLLSSQPARSHISQPIHAIQRLAEKAASGAPITVAYLGGSITLGATTLPSAGLGPLGPYDYSAYDREVESWRALTFSWLRETLETSPGQLTQVNAAIGSTGSELGASRFAHHVGSHAPDLLFVEFVVNDRRDAALVSDPEADGSIPRRLVSIIDQARAANPNVAVLLVLSTMRDFYTEPSQIQSDVATSRDQAIRAASNLKIPFVDATSAYYDLSLPAGVDGARLFDGPSTTGNAFHPSPHGHLTTASAVVKTLDCLLRGASFDFPEVDPLPPLEPSPASPRILLAEEIRDRSISVGWEIQPHGEPPYVTILQGSEVYAATAPGQLDLPFFGRSVSLWLQKRFGGLKAAGRIEVFLDGAPMGVFAHAPGPGEGLLRPDLTLARGLDPLLQHRLRIVVPPDQPEIRIALHGIAIDESLDDTPPAVSLTAPASGAAVSDVLHLQATAASPLGVAQVQFFVDGQGVGGDDSEPYEASLDVRPLGVGSHVVHARALDRAGNAEVSMPVAVTVEEPPDTVRPVIAWTSPADRDAVSGAIVLDASAEDDRGVALVRFFLDGTILGVDTTCPYTFAWDSTTVEDGAHVLMARALDAAENRASASITVLVTNSDTSRPTVAVTSPLDGETVSGAVVLRASAEDDAGVTEVRFFVDGGLVGRDREAPFTVSWDSTTVADGSHAVMARAFDAAGNRKPSAPVTITVANGPP